MVAQRAHDVLLYKKQRTQSRRDHHNGANDDPTTQEDAAEGDDEAAFDNGVGDRGNDDGGDSQRGITAVAGIFRHGQGNGIDIGESRDSGDNIQAFCRKIMLREFDDKQYQRKQQAKFTRRRQAKGIF